MDLEAMRIEQENTKQQLKHDIEVLHRDFKKYRKSKIDYNKARIANVTNNVLAPLKDFAATQRANYYSWREQQHEKAAERERQARIAESERLAEEEIKEAIEEIDKEAKRKERQEKRLKFKQGVAQKVNSTKAKIGSVKNSILATLSSKNIDVKLRNAFDKIRNAGIGALATGVNAVADVKDSIIDFTSEQIANYYLWREQQQEKAAERERQAMIAEKERLKEAEIRARTAEIKEAFKEANRKERQEKRLKFKQGVAQKVNSSKAKIGSVKNSVLATLSSKNIDVKLRNAFDKIRNAGIGALATGVNAVADVKDSIIDFTSEQIANYYLWREQQKEKAAERENQAMIAEKERLKEAEIRARTADHKAGMKEVLHDIERSEYDQKHAEEMEKKEELLKDLKEGVQRFKKESSAPKATGQVDSNSSPSSAASSDSKPENSFEFNDESMTVDSIVEEVNGYEIDIFKNMTPDELKAFKNMTLEEQLAYVEERKEYSEEESKPKSR